MPHTPILDLECEPPKLKRSYLPYVFGVVIGLVLLNWSSIDGSTWFPVLFVSVAFHEMGHVAAGKLAGVDIGGVVICGLSILKSGDRWIWHFDVRRLFSGGVAKPLPKKGEFDRRQSGWMIAGGPLATLLLASVSGFAFARSSGPAGWLSSFWWVNAILLASVMMPASGINKSDGARLWMLLRDEEESRSWTALLQLMTEETAGILPRDWDPELFDGMMRYPAGSQDAAYRELLASYRRCDEDNEDGALEHLERSLAASGCAGKLVRHVCFLEAAGCSALLRNNSKNARIWLARATRLRKPMSRHSSDAAIAQSEGRYEDALRSWDAALGYLSARKLDSGLARFAKLRIQANQAACRLAIQAARTAAVGK